MKLVPGILLQVGIIGDFSCRQREIDVFILETATHFIMTKVPGFKIYFTGNVPSPEIKPAVPLFTGQFQAPLVEYPVEHHSTVGFSRNPVGRNDCGSRYR